MCPIVIVLSPYIQNSEALVLFFKNLSITTHQTRDSTTTETMSSGAKVFRITEYDRSLGLTLERIPNKESNQKQQAVERVFVSHCEKGTLCPGTEQHEITHVGGLATNRGFHACLTHVRKSTASSRIEPTERV